MALAILAVLLVLLLSPLALSALNVSISISSTGQISYSYSVNTYYIGQYSNGTYYAVNQGNQQTYATDPNYASKLINDAMQTASQNGGGTVKIGNGSFRLNTPLIAQTGVYLQVSSSATIYQNTPSSLGASISLLVTKSNVQNFVVDGGNWNGNKGTLVDHRGTSTWGSYFSQYFGISFYGAVYSNIIVKNLVLQNVIGQGIDLRQVSNGYVYNCTVINAGDNPITIEGNDASFYSNTTVESCVVNGGQDVGINSWYVNNVTIKGNTVSNVTQYSGASHWGIAAEWSQNINILNNNVSACEDDLASTSNNTLIANNIVNGQNNIGESAGIHILNSNNNIVTNNTVSNCNLPLATYTNSQTFNVQFINNTILSSNAIWIGANNVTISGGSINSPTDYNGAICLVSALNVNILNVTLSGANGVTDYVQNSHYVRILYSNFTGISGTKVSLGHCTQVYLHGNVGVSDSGTDPLSS